jgi:hypothetical protein
MKKQNNVGKSTNDRAITLITLVITIVILIILAGITINLSLGDNGIFSTAKQAKEQYLNAQTTEEDELNDLYSEILVATGDDSKITISVEDLNKLIDERIESKNTMGKLLWEGTWRDGSITVEGISNYSVCLAVGSNEGIGVFRVSSGIITLESTLYDSSDGCYKVVKEGKGYTINGNTLTTSFGMLWQVGTQSTSWSTPTLNNIIKRDTEPIYKIYGLF